jgi:hypothetical protein
LEPPEVAVCLDHVYLGRVSVSFAQRLLEARKVEYVQRCTDGYLNLNSDLDPDAARELEKLTGRLQPLTYTRRQRLERYPAGVLVHDHRRCTQSKTK